VTSQLRHNLLALNVAAVAVGRDNLPLDVMRDSLDWIDRAAARVHPNPRRQRRVDNRIAGQLEYVGAYINLWWEDITDRRSGDRTPNPLRVGGNDSRYRMRYLLEAMPAVQLEIVLTLVGDGTSLADARVAAALIAEVPA
jgi:hypothetical protein